MQANLLTAPDRNQASMHFSDHIKQTVYDLVRAVLRRVTRLTILKQQDVDHQR